MLICFKNKDFNFEIDLPLSKSESNRALMITYYSTKQFSNLTFGKLSNSDDTILLENLLKIISLESQRNYFPKVYENETIELDCRNAGTVFRFMMTAVSNLQLFWTRKNGILSDEQFSQHLSNTTTRHLNSSDSQIPKFVLTGSDRMKSRPIDSLVEALRSLGVKIEYEERECYPPVLIQPCQIDGGRVEVCVEQSSQYASSLLLASPIWKNGLELKLTGELSSLPYIDMTINMMRNCGIDVERNDRKITVKPGKYNVDNLSIEPDWSAAAFWYEMVALSNTSKILLNNLNINSLQADASAIIFFKSLGVETIASNKGIILSKITDNSKINPNIKCLTFNFTSCPDLFPAVIATCAGLKIDATFTGLKNLLIKESNRKYAMMNELMKINISFENISDDELKMFCPKELPYFTIDNPLLFYNYEDHRIAMALSILSLKIGAISMENTEVVTKSYPDFFESIFKVTSVNSMS